MRKAFDFLFLVSSGRLTTSINSCKPKVHQDNVSTHCLSCVMMSSLGKQQQCMNEHFGGGSQNLGLILRRPLIFQTTIIGFQKCYTFIPL